MKQILQITSPIKASMYLIALFIFIACKKHGCTDPIATNYSKKATADDGSCFYLNPQVISNQFYDTIIQGTLYHNLSNDVTESMLLTAEGNWLISRSISVRKGVTLTIEPGTIIYMASETFTSLNIASGGKVMAEGTANAPIVFTSLSSNPEPGDWGGIVINGESLTNNPFSNNNSVFGSYGGQDDLDCSGIFAYVRIEYAGATLATDYYLSGLTLRAVGEMTMIHHIQVYKCRGNGFNLQGGTVNLSHIISSGNYNDGLQWSDGWLGKSQFIVVEQDQNQGNKGITGSNFYNNSQQGSTLHPQLSNITLIGAPHSEQINIGLDLKQGAEGQISNAIITDFKQSGVRVQDSSSLANMENGYLSVINSIVYGNTINWLDCSNFEADSTNSSQNPNVLVGIVGTTVSNSINPNLLDNWFQSANYAGAINTSNIWTIGWTKDL